MSDQITAIIERTLGTPAAEQRPESNLRQDLGAEDLDILQIVMAIEEAHVIELTDADLEGIDTIGQLRALVWRKFER